MRKDATHEMGSMSRSVGSTLRCFWLGAARAGRDARQHRHWPTGRRCASGTHRVVLHRFQQLDDGGQQRDEHAIEQVVGLVGVAVRVHDVSPPLARQVVKDTPLGSAQTAVLEGAQQRGVPRIRELHASARGVETFAWDSVNGL